MRELKFRAWNGKDFYTPLLTDGLVFRSDRDYEDGIDCDDPVIQYTGLKDKNGVEIYEGFLVEIRHLDDENLFMVGEVRFGINGYPAFEVYDCNNNDTFSDEYNVFTIPDLTLEVIGNIYETPKLLKE